MDNTQKDWRGERNAKRTEADDVYVCGVRQGVQQERVSAKLAILCGWFAVVQGVF